MGNFPSFDESEGLEEGYLWKKEKKGKHKQWDGGDVSPQVGVRGG